MTPPLSMVATPLLPAALVYGTFYGSLYQLLNIGLTVRLHYIPVTKGHKYVYKYVNVY